MKIGRNEPLRVLVYTTLFPNSVQPLLGNFVMERMRRLRPFADLSVIAPAPYFPKLKVHKRWHAFSQIPRSERIAGFDISHPRFPLLPKVAMAIHGLLMFLGSVSLVSKKMREASYDIIDAHYVYPDGFAAVLLGSVFNVPVVVSARGSDINVFPRFRTIRPLIRYVLKRADALIAVSEPLKNAMVKLGCSPEKITVIANGVDTVKFRPCPKEEMRGLLGLPQKRPILISAGNLTPNKGFHVLLEALAGLRRPGVLLVIVGEGAYRAALERKIHELGLKDAVKLVGAQPHEEMCSWYCAADVFCLASATEGCPNVVMEAIACGRPVVATHAAAPVVTSPRLGILVDRKPDELRKALDEALSRDWDQDAIAAYARAHSWDNVSARVLSVFTDVATRRNLKRALAAPRAG